MRTSSHSERNHAAINNGKENLRQSAHAGLQEMDSGSALPAARGAVVFTLRAQRLAETSTPKDPEIINAALIKSTKLVIAPSGHKRAKRRNLKVHNQSLGDCFVTAFLAMTN